MCGIAGFIGPGTRQDLETMMRTLHHRGPDDQGIRIANGVSLGHKRLSIIDLSPNGRQPMCNETQTIWIIFNGEIYNFRSLRERLIERGHLFRSRTDTETIIHLYEEYGSKAFELLNGMFAFALLDETRRKLYLVRDRMGQKPLYYAETPQGLVFASEARAVNGHPTVNQGIDTLSLAKYFLYEHIPTPDCIWASVRKLIPAGFLEYDLDRKSYTIDRYWHIRFLPHHTLSGQECLEELDRRIRSAVARHLESDVPLGVYLSGGIDSSTVAWHAQRLLDGRLKTFTVAFGEETFGEQDLARETAQRLGTEHTEIPFSADEYFQTAFEIIPLLDEPFADSSLIPAFHLNRLARSRITVALGGEGGDELFIGYPWFLAHRALGVWRAMPAFLRNQLLIPLIRTLPSSAENETWEYRLKKFIEPDEFLPDSFRCQQTWVGSFQPNGLSRLFRPMFRSGLTPDSLFENLIPYRKDAEAGESLMEGLVRQTQHKYLMDDGLTKTDRASMLNSLETRAPLLDADLVDWVNRIPFHQKCPVGNMKRLLKKLMRGRISDEILFGKKRGFTPPIASWFRHQYQHRVKEVLFTEDPWIDSAYVRELWEEHVSGRANHRKPLWTLFSWKLWQARNLP